MARPSFLPAAALARGDITLVLGERIGSSVKGYRVSMHNDVADELRDVAQATISELNRRTPVLYSDDLAFDPETQYMLIERHVLTTYRYEHNRGGRAAHAPERLMVEMDAVAFEIMQTASSLPQLAAGELKRKSFLFYAALIGDDLDRRASFVRQWNPWRIAQAGRIVTLFGDALRRVEQPILAFEREFDMVVTNEHVAALRPAPFEKVFRDIDSMAARIPTWSDAAVAALPLDAASKNLVRDVAGRSRRVAGQVRRLYERGYLSKTYDTTGLREEMMKEGLDADRLIKNGELVLKEADVSDILKLIDERFYQGWHSAARWDVGTRTRR